LFIQVILDILLFLFALFAWIRRLEKVEETIKWDTSLDNTSLIRVSY